MNFRHPRSPLEIALDRLLLGLVGIMSAPPAIDTNPILADKPMLDPQAAGSPELPRAASARRR